MIYILLFFTFTPLTAFAQDKVELQWALCEKDAASFLKKAAELSFSSSTAQKQSYYDTEALDYLNLGISLHQKESTESSSTKIKITVSPKQKVDRDWLEENGGKCEYDSYGKVTSLRCELENDGEDLWSDLQREFLRRHRLPDYLSRLYQWGPYKVKNWEGKSKDWGKLKLNELNLGNGTFILELSAKSPKEDASDLRKEMEHWLASQKVQLCAEQVGKFQRILSSAQKSK